VAAIFLICALLIGSARRTSCFRSNRSWPTGQSRVQV
jgi:hypothetical protein